MDRGTSHKRLPLTVLSLWKRREVLLYQRTLINVEIMELEYYHLQNTIVLKILKLVKVWLQTMYSQKLNVSPPQGSY